MYEKRGAAVDPYKRRSASICRLIDNLTANTFFAVEKTAEEGSGDLCSAAFYVSEIRFGNEIYAPLPDNNTSLARHAGQSSFCFCMVRPDRQAVCSSPASCVLNASITASMIMARVSLLRGWAISLNSPSGVFLLGIATKYPSVPSMILMS